MSKEFDADAILNDGITADEYEGKRPMTPEGSYPDSIITDVRAFEPHEKAREKGVAETGRNIGVQICLGFCKIQQTTPEPFSNMISLGKLLLRTPCLARFGAWTRNECQQRRRRGVTDPDRFKLH